MYCANCGHEIDPKAVICVHCGVRTNERGRFCKNCGAETVAGGNICVKCGMSLSTNVKSKLTAGLLGIFLGCFGVHNFYLGYTGKAIAQLLITLFTCGLGAFATALWGLIEGVLILSGNIAVDASGAPLGD